MIHILLGTTAIVVCLFLTTQPAAAQELGEMAPWNLTTANKQVIWSGVGNRAYRVCAADSEK